MLDTRHPDGLPRARARPARAAAPRPGAAPHAPGPLGPGRVGGRADRGARPARLPAPHLAPRARRGRSPPRSPPSGSARPMAPAPPPAATSPASPPGWSANAGPPASRRTTSPTMPPRRPCGPSPPRSRRAGCASRSISNSRTSWGSTTSRAARGSGSITMRCSRCSPSPSCSTGACGRPGWGKKSHPGPPPQPTLPAVRRQLFAHLARVVTARGPRCRTRFTVPRRE